MSARNTAPFSARDRIAAARATSPVAAALLALVLAAAPAAAEICAVDRAPGATVLLPYFEVDLTRGLFGETTLFELQNALPKSVLARVTLWSDLGVPTYAFDVHLTGYDVQSFNLRDLFFGLGPVTGSEASPRGELSLPGELFEGCGDEIAVEPPVLHLRAAHTGAAVPVFGNLCAGRDHGDGRARGYLTADVVGACGEPFFPSDPGYFGPDGIARYDNALWGIYMYVDPLENYAQAENLVRLEADPEAFGAGDTTFYGRYHGHSGIDAREPLPPAWAVRSLSGGGFDAGTEWVTWRETPGPPLPFACGSTPQWYPLPLSQLVGFDEEENPTDLRELVFVVEPRIADGAAQRGHDFVVAAGPGWIYADLGRSPLEPAQAYVAAVIGAEGRYSIGSEATVMAPACGTRGCELGEQHGPGKLCIESADGDDVISEGETARIAVFADVCYGGCEFVHQAACAVRPGGAGLEVASRFCVDPPRPLCPVGICVPPGASCDTPPLAAGEHTMRAAELELTFTVPATVPPGGLCVGGIL